MSATAARATRWQHVPWPDEAANAIRLALTSIVAIYLCMLLELDRPEWAGWTVLSVTLATRASSLQKCLWRMLGTAIGGEVAILLAANFAQDTLAFDIALCAWLALVTTLSSLERGQQSYGFALMGFTVPIITLGEVQTPGIVFHVAIDRCSTILIGVGCAFISACLVAQGVRSVSSMLADRLDATVAALSEWIGRVERGETVAKPPIDTVLALDDALSDGFTEQPSLRSGGTALTEAANRCLRVIAVEMLAARLPDERQHHGAIAEAAALLGIRRYDPAQLHEAMGEAAARLRAEARVGTGRRTSVRPLQRDRDTVQALRNGIRAALAVGVASGFWYVSEWPSGSSAVSFCALTCVLLGARPNGAIAARNFLLGAVLAAVVGITVRFTALTVSGVFPLLAAVLLPVMILAATGRLDARAASAQGYAIAVLDFIDPTNVMTYDLGASLDTAVADLIGIGMAVAAFAAVVPAASAATLRTRAKRRMSRDLDAVIDRLPLFRPRRYSFLSRNADRLTRLAPEGGAVIEIGEEVLLTGLLLLALRAEDEGSGRRVGAALRAAPGTRDDRLRSLVADLPEGAIEARRIAAIARIAGRHAADGDPPAWPGLPWRVAA